MKQRDQAQLALKDTIRQQTSLQRQIDNLQQELEQDDDAIARE